MEKYWVNITEAVPFRPDLSDLDSTFGNATEKLCDGPEHPPNSQFLKSVWILVNFIKEFVAEYHFVPFESAAFTQVKALDGDQSGCKGIHWKGLAAETGVYGFSADTANGPVARKEKHWVECHTRP